MAPETLRFGPPGKGPAPPGVLRLGGREGQELLAFAAVQDHWARARAAWTEARHGCVTPDLAWMLKLEILRLTVFGLALEGARAAGAGRVECPPVHRRLAWVARGEGWRVPPGRFALLGLPGGGLIVGAWPAAGLPRRRPAPPGEGPLAVFAAFDAPGRGLNAAPVAALARAWAARGGRAVMVCGPRPAAPLRDGPWGIEPLRPPFLLAPGRPGGTGLPAGWSPREVLLRVRGRLARLYAPLVERHLRFWNGLLARLRPAALVAVSDQVPQARAAVAAAHAAGVPAFTCHAALVLPSPMYADLAAHYLCAQDRELASHLAAAGVTPDRIRVTGFLDLPPAGETADRPPRRVLLCTENAAAPLFLALLAELRLWAEAAGGRRIRVRVHPEEDRAPYTAAAGGIVELSPGGAAGQDLAWADAAVVGYSTMGARALHQGRLLLALGAGALAVTPYGRHGEAVRLASPAEAGAALAALARPGARAALAAGRERWRAALGWPADPAAAAAEFMAEVAAGGPRPLPPLLP